MDIDALKKIEEMAITSAELMPDVDVPCAVIPDTCHVANLEYLLADPLSMRATFKTQRIDSLLIYAAQNATTPTDYPALYIQDESLSAVLVIDNGTSATPKWQRHKAEIALRKNASFKALCDHAKCRHTQQEFVDFITDFAHCLTFYADADMENLMATSTAIQAIQRVNVAAAKNASFENSDHKKSRSAMEEIELKGEIKPPALMVMSCVPYADLGERSIVCRVITYISTDNIVFGCRLVAEEKLKEELAAEFTWLLASHKAMENVEVYNGTITRE